MNKTSKIAIAILCLITTHTAFAQQQDIRFSQPVNSPLLINPSMMALTNDFRATFNYRNQWGSIDKGYQTYSGSLAYPLFLKTKKDTTGSSSRLDFGANVLYEKAGGLKRVNANLSIGYGLHLSAEHLVSASLNIGMVNYAVNWNDQTFDEQYVWGSYNSNNPTGENPTGAKTNVDVGFGILWHYAPVKNKFQAFAGVSGYHLNQPNVSFTGGNSKLPSRFNFQAGVKVIGKKIEFTPVFMYNLQGPNKNLTAGMLLAYKFEKAGKIVVGAWYNEREIAVQAGYEHSYFNLHYSYGFGNSALTRNTRGLMVHEITLALKWSSKKSASMISFF